MPTAPSPPPSFKPPRKRTTLRQTFDHLFTLCPEDRICALRQLIGDDSLLEEVMPPKSASAPKKRKSLADKLDHLDTENNDEIFELMQDLENDEELSRGFQPFSPKTQKKLEHHLDIYRRFMKISKKLPDDISPEEMDLICWPNDQATLETQLKVFVMMVYRMAEPRSNANQRIQYRTLVSYRASMLHHVRQIFDARNQLRPNTNRLFRAMTEAMQFVQKKYQQEKATRAQKTYLGLAELRQLFDFEMWNNNCIENSEQHQLAWAIGRIAAVRPGSLAPSSYGRSSPLSWKNVKIIRLEEPGMFQAQLTFSNVNIKAPENPELTHPGNEEQPLKVCINSPSDANKLIFSVPHRLIIMALRRNLLQDYSSIEEVLNGELYNISIKSDHLEDPLFFRSTPKGTDIDMTSPIRSSNLTAYLSERGRAIGYSAGITFYSLRRRAASDIALLAGVETSRTLMGHAPGTLTLERHYIANTASIDATAISLGEDVGKEGHSMQMARVASAELAQNVLSKEHLDRLKNGAVSSLASRMMLEDDNFPVNASPAEMKQYRKRIKRAARDAVIAESHSEQAARITRQEMTARLAQTEISRFAQAVTDRARAFMQDAERASADLDEGDEGDIEDSGLDVEDDPLFEPEEDLEARAARGGVNAQITLDIGDEDEVEFVSTNELSYLQQAESFMRLIMENSLNQKVKFTDTDRTCFKCKLDPTIPESDKQKKFRSSDKLNSHLLSSIHSGFEQWRRRNAIEARKRRDADPELEAPFICTYCPHDPPTAFKSLVALEKHVEGSTEASTSREHEQAKYDDGWMDPDFVIKASPTNAKDAEVRRKRKLAASGYEAPVELPHPIQYKTRPDLQHGHFLEQEQLPAHWAGSLNRSDQAALLPPPPGHWKGILTFGPPPTIETGLGMPPLPVAWKDHVIWTTAQGYLGMQATSEGTGPSAEQMAAALGAQPTAPGARPAVGGVEITGEGAAGSDEEDAAEDMDFVYDAQNTGEDVSEGGAGEAYMMSGAL